MILAYPLGYELFVREFETLEQKRTKKKDEKKTEIEV